MDINDIRNIVTVLSFVIFAGIVKFTLSRRNQAGFDEAQMLPFTGESPDSATAQGSEEKHE